MIAKIGFMANDSVTSLKLLEKGLLKEDMAVAVLIDFPFQIIGGWYVFPLHWPLQLLRCDLMLTRMTRVRELGSPRAGRPGPGRSRPG